VGNDMGRPPEVVEEDGAEHGGNEGS
jgi:hypothetical protein